MSSFEKYLSVHNLLDEQKVKADFQWQPLRDGVQISYLYQEPNEGPSAALLCYEPEAKVPNHYHLGFEHIFILAGSQEDDNGEYKQGSLLIHKKDTNHQIYSPNGCLALAIWEKPVSFS